MACTPLTPQQELDAAISRALQNKRVSVDGLLAEGPSLDELRKFSAGADVPATVAAGKRPVLYQRMYSPSSGCG